MAEVTRRTSKFRSKTPSSCPFPCSTAAISSPSNPKAQLGRSVLPSPATLLNLHNPAPSSVRFSSDWKGKNKNGVLVGQIPNPPPKRACICAPTNHPGSFRCNLHKGGSNNTSPLVSSVSNVGNQGGSGQYDSNSNRLILRRMALYISLTRIGAVEARSLAKPKRASSTASIWQSRRRVDVQRRPSRLSIMSKE